MPNISSSRPLCRLLYLALHLLQLILWLNAGLLFTVIAKCVDCIPGEVHRLQRSAEQSERGHFSIGTDEHTKAWYISLFNHDCFQSQEDQINDIYFFLIYKCRGFLFTIFFPLSLSTFLPIPLPISFLPLANDWSQQRGDWWGYRWIRTLAITLESSKNSSVPPGLKGIF